MGIIGAPVPVSGHEAQTDSFRESRIQIIDQSSLDLFFREFDFQRQWASDAVGQVRQSNEHMQV